MSKTTSPKRKRIASGVYEGPNGRDACVTVGTGAGRLQVARRFSLDEPLRDIKAWQRKERVRLEQLRPRSAHGPFEKDIVRYLLTLADRPRLQAERHYQLAWWAEQRGHDGKRFGDRRRHTFQRDELQAALAARATLPSRHRAGETMSPSSLRHYRTALFHLYSTLDGKSSPNPVRDVPAPPSPDPEPRAIPYAIIEAIFDAMQDQQRASKIDPQQAATIAELAARPGANKSAIARQYGVTETAIRKIIAESRPREDVAAKTKLRLAVMAYVGLPPAQIMLLSEADVNWDEPSVLVKGRKKGKGSRTARLPLSPKGAVALRAFFAADATGPFDTTSARRVWWRAIQTMCDRLAQTTDQLAADALLESLRQVRARPYDLRHSYLTQIQLAGRNLHATQQLAMHSDSRQTQRYTLAAVNQQLLDVVAALGNRLDGRARNTD